MTSFRKLFRLNLLISFYGSVIGSVIIILYFVIEDATREWRTDKFKLRMNEMEKFQQIEVSTQNLVQEVNLAILCLKDCEASNKDEYIEYYKAYDAYLKKGIFPFPESKFYKMDTYYKCYFIKKCDNSDLLSRIYVVDTVSQSINEVVVFTGLINYVAM